MSDFEWLDDIIVSIDETLIADAAEYIELDELEDAHAVNIERH